ncbi:MAG: glycogen synthase, partial [Aggregatilineales bacterium]
IPGRYHPLLNRYSLNNNLLGIASAFSDMVTTVSPTYATEIRYPYAGYELAGLMDDRQDDLTGILNGLDIDLWNPATDKHLVANFDTDTLEKRLDNKRHLQSFARLPVSDDIPVIGMVTRLTPQKGLNMAIPAIRTLMQETEVQIVILGTGHDDIEHEVWKLTQEFRNQARAFIQYDNSLASRIYGGCDLFLMPSKFEPCGIGQMLAMRYGALPIVRKTGGLADTVANYDNQDADAGTGFVFEWEQSSAVLGTMRWAVETYTQHKDAWNRMQQRAMQQDFSWKSSARQYIEVYENALNKHRG